MSQPMSPFEARRAQRDWIPNAVFDVFNMLLMRQLNATGRVCILQETVVRELTRRGFTREDIFEQNWLNVEDAYRRVGWNVTYDKPAYNESGEAMFVFSVREQHSKTAQSMLDAGDAN